MKTQSPVLFQKLGNFLISGLGIQLPDASVKDSVNNQRRIFSSAELWNIQRRRKQFVIR